jgi:xanthine/uracil permease
MKLSRIAVISALICIGAWTAKSVAIGLAGGLDRSPLEGPLFFLGLVSFVATVVLLALALTTARPLALRALAVLVGVVAGVGFSVVTEMVLTTVRPADPSWVWSEVNLWVGAAALFGLVLVTHHRRRPARV